MLFLWVEDTATEIDQEADGQGRHRVDTGSSFETMCV